MISVIVAIIPPIGRGIFIIVLRYPIHCNNICIK
nr:MAG TPA: hypothetical protein [Caudoviricetes sp.]